MHQQIAFPKNAPFSLARKHAPCLQALAELLTTNKLSELACLTLYLMYEKKNGKKSVWYEFIKVSVPPDRAVLECVILKLCKAEQGPSSAVLMKLALLSLPVAIALFRHHS